MVLSYDTVWDCWLYGKLVNNTIKLIIIIIGVRDCEPIIV